MTIVSSFAYAVGTRATVIVRFAGVVIAFWFILSMTMFVIYEKPAFIQDVTKYWFGAIAYVILVVLQGIYNRKHFGVMLGVRDFDF